MTRRLVFLTQSYAPDQTILGVTRAWVAALATRGAGVDVIALVAGRPPEPPEPGVRVSSLGKERGAGRAAQLLALYRALLAALPQAGAVFVHMVPRYAVLAAPLAALFRRPIMLWYAQGGVSRDLRLAARAATWIITPTRGSFPLSGPAVDGKVHVTGHGIDVRQYAPDGASPAEPGRLLAVGRLSPAKRYETLLDCVASLPERSWQLRVAGPPLYESDRAYAAELAAQAQRLGIVGQTSFLGAVPYEQMPQEYRRAWALAHTSATGSLDKVVLEAMACGTPAVSTAPSSRTALGPLAGDLWCDGDGELTARLADALAWPAARRQELGAACRAQVERHHSLDRWADQVMDLLRRR